MKIGVVDLYTSHPENFVPILRELGCEIRCVWDSGDVRPPGFAEEFARKFNIPHVCESLQEMVEEVGQDVLRLCECFVRSGAEGLLDVNGHRQHQRKREAAEPQRLPAAALSSSFAICESKVDSLWCQVQFGSKPVKVFAIKVN